MNPDTAPIETRVRAILARESHNNPEDQRVIRGHLSTELATVKSILAVALNAFELLSDELSKVEFLME